MCGRCNALRKVCAFSYPQAGRAASELSDARSGSREADNADAGPSTAAPLSSPAAPLHTILSTSVDLPPVSPVVPLATEEAAAALADYVE